MENILKKNKKYLVGVSGGPDSIFLLTKLIFFFNGKLDNLIVAHVNYQKRKSSFRDQQIVQALCLKYNLKFYVKLVNDEDYDKYHNYHHNFQAIARSIRYDFFCDLQLIEQTEGVIIAHNLNDKIETYLWQKQRNNIVNYYGLKSISIYQPCLAKKKKILFIFRPILDIKRSYIEKYLDMNNINYGIDETNLMPIYQRNIIRKTLSENEFDNYILNIKKDNITISNEKKQAINFFVKKNFIVSDFNKILDSNIKLRILYYFFEQKKLSFLINQKKKKYLLEVIKQLQIVKNNHLIKINDDYVLVKTNNQLYIYLANYFKEITIDFFASFDKSYFITWKDYHLKIDKNILLKYGLCFKNNCSYTITNNQKLLANMIYNNKVLKKYWQDQKIDLITRYYPCIIDNTSNKIFIFFGEKNK